MKKFLALALALAMMTALSAGCGRSFGDATANAGNDASTSATFEAQTWKFACSAAASSTWMEAAEKFGDLIGEATNGAVTVEYYPSDELTSGSASDGINALIDGTTTVSMHSALAYCAVDPRFGVVALPFLFDSQEDADAKLGGAGGSALKSILEDQGLHCMAIGDSGFRCPTNSLHEIASVTDMKDLKICVADSPVIKRAYELWGAAPVDVSWASVFTALQIGTYDGQENSLTAADAASIQDVQKYVTCWTGSCDCLFFCMNQELYASLTPELQAIVDDCGQQAIEYQKKLNREEEQAVLNRWAKAGVTVTELSEEAAQQFRDAAAPCYDEFSQVLTPELIAAFTDQ